MRSATAEVPASPDIRRGFFDVDENIGAMQNVVRKIFLDDVAFVAEANDEVVQPVMGVMPHNMPKDGVRADLDHWLLV
jgi:hypothetical protein